MPRFQKKQTGKTEYNFDDLFKPSVDLKVLNKYQLAIYGKEGVGKTHLSLTAPGEKLVIDTEGNAKRIINFFDKDVQEQTKIFEIANYLTEDGDIDYSKAISIFETAVKGIVEYTEGRAKGTIIIDSMTDIWSWYGYWLSEKPDVRHLSSGQVARLEWHTANKHHAKMLQMLDSTGWNIVFTGRARELYGSDGSPLGIYEGKWQWEIPYKVGLCGELTYINKKPSLKIFKCKDGRELIGETIPDAYSWEDIINYVVDKTKIKITT